MKSLNLKSTSALALALIAGGVVATATPVAAAVQSSPSSTTGKVEFTAGDLTLNQVPNFDFGTQNILSTDQTYTATADGETKITDLRGDGNGWELTVKATELTAGGKTLKNAQMSLENGTTANTNSETVTATDAVLVPNTAAKVFSAAANNGNGESTLTWDKANAKLFVPGTSTKSAAEYTATLTWTLADAPTAP